ncbi:MAG: hypothetical protein U1E15_09030, partial [Hyphomicrobiales bacterium]
RADVSAEFDGEAALALFGSPEGSLTWSLVGDGKSANIIQVSKVTVPAFDPASDDAKKATADLKASITNDGAITFMKSLRADADVSINEPLWANIRGTSAEQ